MKRLFLAIGMAALMLISGTNVYLANQRNEMESNLSLENVEALGWWEVVLTLAILGIDKAWDYYNDPGPAYVESITSRDQEGNEVFEAFDWYCYTVKGGHDNCTPGEHGVGSRIITYNY